ncbi:hypothetical protein NI382_01050 [Vibrio parahaemolyticus]|nr:hypothetical protein NI382_01050 [Vibrio parahaemolyticus]
MKKFPLVNRCELQTSRKRYLSNKFSVGIEFNTSGSSGDPLYFYRTALCSAVDDAHQLSSYKKMGFESGDRIISFNGFQPSDFLCSKNIFWKRKTLFGELPFGSVQFSSNLLNTKNFKYYLNEIERIKPAIIKGYPSSVYSFFKMIEDSGLSVSFPIKAIQLSSENIFEYQVELIERVSRSRVFRQYGHTECAMFAEKNLDKNYQFSPFYGYLEVLDKDGKQVNVGEVGQITVTGYNCFKQVFIRYETGDFGRFQGVCHGKQVVDSIMGREQDYLIAKSGDAIPITSIISGSHLDINKYVSLWQIKQVAIGELEVYTLKTDNVLGIALSK